MDDATRNENPQTRMLPISEVKRALSRLVDEVQQGNTRVLIEHSGSPAAALVSASDLKRLMRLEQGKAVRRKALEAIGAAFADVPLEEIEAQLARIAAEGPQVAENEPARKLA